MNTLLIDIETYCDEPIAETGVYRYAESPSLELLLFSYSIDYGEAQLVDVASGEKIPTEIISALTESSVKKIAHNMVFEISCLEKTLGIALDASQWEDTMIYASMLGFPKSLAKACEVLNLSVKKMASGTSLINLFCTPSRGRAYPTDKPEKWEEFKEYCKTDVNSEVALAKRVIGKVSIPSWERRIQLEDFRINKRGVNIHLDLVRNAVAFTESAREELMAEAKELTGLDNPNSVQQLKAWIKRVSGLNIDKLNKDAMSSFDEERLGKRASRMLAIRRELSKTSLAKYPAMLKCVCSDGRIRGITQYYGASQTGRFAGRLVQLQNLPQNHLKHLDYARSLVIEGDYDCFSMCFGNVSNTLSELIRTALIPSPGRVFHVCDFSAIEARVLAWLSGEYWVLDAFRNGEDIYCTTASRMFGVVVQKNGENSDMRKYGKVCVLALGYQGGVNALRAMGADKMGISESTMLELVSKWRASNKSIVNFWKTLEDAAKICIATGKEVKVNRGITFSYRYGLLIVTLPSKRAICYPRARLGKDAQTGRDIILYERQNQTTSKWEETNTYGGKIAENITQAVARDILCEVILRCADKGIEIVFHVHDEIVADCPKDIELKEIEELFSTPIHWCEDLPLKGAGYSGDYYFKD